MPPSGAAGTTQASQSASLIQEVSSALWSFGPSQRAALYAQNWAWPNLAIGLPAAMQLYQNGWCNYDDYRSLAILLGADPKLEGTHGYEYVFDNGALKLGKARGNGASSADFSRVLWDRAWIPPLNTAISLFLRGLVGQDYLNHVYLRNGINVPELRTLVENLQYEMPTADRVIQFAQRQQWDAQMRDRLQLDDEYDEDTTWAAFVKAAGYGPVNVIDDQGNGRQIDMRKEAWAHHWRFPGLAEAQSMLHRLRPDNFNERVGKAKAAGNFTADDYDDLLKISGYNALSRRRLAGIAYRLPERRTLITMAKSGAIDLGQLTSLVRSLGYDEQYVPQVTQSIWGQRFKKLSINETRQLIERQVIPKAQASQAIVDLGYDQGDADRLLSIPRKSLDASFVQTLMTRGLISKTEGIKRLEWDGYSHDDAVLLADYAMSERTFGDAKQAIAGIREAYRLGVIERPEALQRLVDRGNTLDEADMAISFIELDIQIGHVKSAMQCIRQQYLHAHFTEGAARVELRRLGISDPVIDRTIGEWNLCLTTKHRELAATQIVNAFKRGLVNINTLAARLSALGYGSDDINLLSLSGMQDIAKSNAAAALRASRSVAAQQRAARQQLGAILRQQKQAQRDLARHGTPSQLAKWYVQKLITARVARARLRALGWPDADITTFLESATLSASKKQSSAKPTKG